MSARRMQFKGEQGEVIVLTLPVSKELMKDSDPRSLKQILGDKAKEEVEKFVNERYAT